MDTPRTRAIGAALIVSVLSTLLFLFRSLHDVVTWPFVHDAPLLHYAVYLSHHGFRFYQDIHDMNMPGAYLTEDIVMRTLGSGRVGWILWDFILSGLLVAYCIQLFGKKRIAYGWIAGVIAVLAHYADGAAYLGERDWMVAVFLVGAALSVLRWIEHSGPVCLLLASLQISFAAWVKPTALLCFVLVFWGIYHNRKQAQSSRVFIALGVGFVVPAFVIGTYLWTYGTRDGFIDLILRLLPYYASVGNAVHLEKPALILCLIVAARFFSPQSAVNRPRLILLQLLSAVGLLSFYLQGKGFVYHRYILLTGVCLLLSTLIMEWIDSGGIRTSVGIVVLLLLAVLVPSRLITLQLKRAYPTGTITALEQDLGHFSHHGLEHSIQCLDMIHGGCINVLYRMHAIQTTGFIHDYYLFPARQTSITSEYQETFLRALTDAPPRVLVVSEQDWPANMGYSKLERWPAFVYFLNAHYDLKITHTQGPHDFAGYRVYVIKA
jgi:hypothetical protein